MKKNLQRIISVLLVALMVAGAAPLAGLQSLFSVTAYAENIEAPCGNGVRYSLNTVTGVITISGRGAMTDYETATQVPWQAYRANIKNAVIGEGVTAIGNFAFKFCGSLESVSIPSTVSRIGIDAFGTCSALTTVTIAPNSMLEAIETSAFDGCIMLESFSFPTSIKTVGYYSFRDCSSLSDLSFPFGMEEIVDRAFYNCTGLSTIYIPSSLTSIGSNVFLDCTGITAFTVAPGNREYSSDEYGVLFNASKSVLINYPSNNSRTQYSVPDGVSSIYSLAFSDAVHLKSLYIPADTVSIGDSAFAGCSSLEAFVVNGGNTGYVVDASGALFSRSRGNLISFPAGSAVTNYTVPNRVISISDYAFYQCANLENVTIPKSVTSIGRFALGYSSDEPTYYTGDSVAHYLHIYESFNINCYMESAANKYAEENGITYHLLDQVWNGTAASKFESGSGTQADPYIIMNGEQLYLMAGIINGDITQYNGSAVTYDMFNSKCYKLGSDINLNYINNWEKWFSTSGAVLPSNAWKPIGGFFGEFDGDGHAINGVFVSGGTDNKGLFSAVVGGTIKNLGVYKSYFRGGSNVGSIAGDLSAGTVINCYGYSYVSAATANAGGVVGKNSGGEIIGCYAGGYVNCTYDCVGGIAGLNNATIKKCYNVSNPKGRNNVGGIAGSSTGTVSMCYSVTAVKSNYVAGTGIGAIIGSNSGTVSRCYYLYASASGGINGADVVNSAQALHEADLRDESSFVSWDFENEWTMNGNAGYLYPEHTGFDYMLSVPQLYTITATVNAANSHGSLTPAGTTAFAADSTVVYNIAPATGHSISAVIVDGVAAENITGQYVFNNIVGNHTIEVSFEANNYDAVFYPGAGNAFDNHAVGESITVPTAYGSTPIAPTPPVIPEYDFDGWSPEISAMTTAGATYTATYVKSHIHDFTFSTETVNPTCTMDGSITRTCRCGETQVEPIVSDGHKWEEEYTIDKEPTCIYTGSQSIHCSVCDEKNPDTVTVIPALNHEWSTEYTVYVEPTCTQTGKEARYCIHEGCNESQYNKTIPPLGHSYPDENYIVSVPATCTADGRESCVCANGCGTVDERVIKSTGHSYSEWVVSRAATCASDGEETRSCPKCEDVQTRIIAKAHTPEAGYTVDLEPTCAHPGSKSIHCAVCGEHTSITPIPATGHSFGDWVTVREAAASTRGTQKHVCADCGYTELRFTSILSPNFTVDSVAAVTYNGSAQCPAVTVRSSLGTALTQGTDYFVEYYNNVDAGKALLVVTGMGSYYGSAEIFFTISPAPISSANIAVEACSATGLPLHPQVSVKLGSLTVSPQSGYTLSYTGNVAAGAGAVTVSGIRNFTGSATAVMNIAAGNAAFTVDAIAPQVFTGSYVVPAVKVRSAQDRSVILSPSTDYSVTYANNVAAGCAVATVTGKGAYSGTLSVGYVIIPKDISTVTLPVLSGSAFNFTGITALVDIYDGGKKLASGSDYTVKFVNNFAAGEAKAIVTGAGSYCGVAELPFTIAKADINALAGVSAEPPYYTGSAVKPVLTVKVGSHTLREGADFTVVYANNTQIGSNTATATITGIGNFFGTKSVRFSILNNPVSGITLSETNVSLGYDKTITISATIQPANATNKKIVWSVTSGGGYIKITPSADALKCTVKGTGKGTATITATTEDGNFVARCTVNATMTFFQRIAAFFRKLFGGSNSIMSVFYVIK